MGFNLAFKGLTRFFCSSIFHAVCIVCFPWIQLVCHNFELVAVAALLLGGWNTSYIAKRLHWKKLCSLCHFAYFTSVPVCVLLIQILYYKANFCGDVLLYCIEYEIILFLSHYVFIMSDVSNKSSRSEGDIYSMSCTFFVWQFLEKSSCLSFVLSSTFIEFCHSAWSHQLLALNAHVPHQGSLSEIYDIKSACIVISLVLPCWWMLYHLVWWAQLLMGAVPSGIVYLLGHSSKSLLYTTHPYEPEVITHHLFVA